MAWVATAFVAYAVARVAGMIAAGPLIDRFAASRVLPVVLIPQMIALLLVAMLGGDWVAIPYFALFGITSALVNVLATALWVEEEACGYEGRSQDSRHRELKPAIPPKRRFTASRHGPLRALLPSLFHARADAVFFNLSRFAEQP